MYQQVPVDSTFLTTIGTAKDDAVIALTKAGKPYARLTLKSEAGKETLWLSIVTFEGALVESARTIRAGARLEAAGRLQVRTWTGTDGRERTSVGIVAATLTLLAQPPQANDDPFDDVPF
ncbi:MAG TPA: single-stranded DNA-binding protein [Chloroflexota bacterium]|nr:single-stranded DNA-binding protein [Chloroflexota bacterium]